MDRSPQASREQLVLTVAILGTGMVYLDQTALNVAIPALQQALNAEIAGIQWILDSYILTLSSLMLLGGVLGDRYGRVRVYTIGMIIFVCTSLLCGLSQSVGQLVAARTAQGIGGALVVPGGLALINAAVAPERLGRVIGTWGTMTSMVIAFGPTLGGWLVDTVSWRMVFLINVPLGLLAILLGLTRVPESKNPNQTGPLDLPGALTMLGGLLGLLFGLIEGPRLGWKHPFVWSTLGSGLALLAAFLWIEARSVNPILPLPLFRYRQFSIINLITLIHWIAINAFFFFFPIILQQSYAYSATQAGMSLLPISAMIILLSRASGMATDRFGARRLIMAGIGLTGVAFGLLAWYPAAKSFWIGLLPIMLIYGIGLGLLIVPLTTAAMGSLPSELSGLASGVNNAAARIAGMLAIAIFGALLAQWFGESLAYRLEPIALSPDIRAALMAESDNLGALRLPAGLSTDMTDDVSSAIRHALSDSFQTVMWLCLGIAGMSLLIVARMREG